jgi:porin
MLPRITSIVRRYATPVLIPLLVGSAILAEEPTRTTIDSPSVALQDTSCPAEKPPAAIPDFGGDFCSRPKLTGNWCGERPCLAQQGITFDGNVTQFYQGVVHGGLNDTFRYGGHADYFLNMDMGKLMDMKGLFVSMHADTRFGQDVNFDAVGLAPVNSIMLYPSQEHETAITGLLITQALSEQCMVTVGKFNLFDLFNQIYPQIGRGVDSFMNISSLLPISVGRPLNLSVMGAGITTLNEGRVQGTVAVLDTNNSTTTSGFDDLFDNGAVIVGYWRIFTCLCDLPGSHALLGIYSNKKYRSTDPESWVFVPDVGIVAGEETGTWNLTYFWEQKLWVDPCDAQRNIGALTSLGLSDGNPNPVRWGATVAVQAQGLVSDRPADTMGVSYFYTGLSSDFKSLGGRLIDLQDVQGVELYYNAAVTPWFHLTADLQIVEPADESKDTAVVIGLRGKIDF